MNAPPDPVRPARKWEPIETLSEGDTSRMFACSEWVLVATSDGRVTEAMPFYGECGWFLWICLRGQNCFHPGREPEPNYLAHHVTHWQPLPDPPSRHEDETAQAAEERE